MCSENYKIIPKDGAIRAFSKERIPYQPEDWRKNFREDLRCALSKLKPPTEEQYLKVSYCGTDAYYDLENILFYNIGPSHFRQIATHRIFAKKCSQQEMKTTDEGEEFPHRYAYEICDSQNQTVFWGKHSLAAEWEPLSISGSLSRNKPVDYWRALKEKPKKVHSHYCKPQELRDSNFGVKIKLSVPKTKNVNLTSVIKPMLDGAICAFHSADEVLKEESSTILKHLRVSEQLLFSRDHDILGECRFIYHYRKNSVKWNPKDNLCVAFEIEAEYNDDRECRFSGKIYKL